MTDLAAPPAGNFMEDFRKNTHAVTQIIDSRTEGRKSNAGPRPIPSIAIAQHEIDNKTLPSIGALVQSISRDVEDAGSISNVPAARVKNVRNDMYLASEMLRFVPKANKLNLSPEETGSVKAYKGSLDDATRLGRSGSKPPWPSLSGLEP